MNEKNDRIVEGYCFGTSEDAETARQELKKIEYLEEHMEYDHPENLLLVYKKALENRVFQTPVGWEYLKKLQKKLKESGMDGDVAPIMIHTVFANRVGDDIRIPEPRIKPKPKSRLRRNFIVSVIFNVILAAAVGAMFAIALNASAPNILNYEKVLQNRYSAWEQELSKREAAVREKEREWIKGE